MTTVSSMYILFCLILLFILFRKKILHNELWRATMTPLASIIGSGFLIAAPLLNELSGKNAPYLMLGLCLLSYGIGEVIRWNIVDIEPLAETNQLPKNIYVNEKLGNWALALAYVLSISYYLYLFSAFMLKTFQIDDELWIKGLTIIVMSSIALFGHRKGLDSLEKIESIAVNLKLSIIFTFIFGLILFNYSHFNENLGSNEHLNLNWKTISISLGLLIMVQGFETSRYLGEKYDTKTRVKSMRLAQILSSIIYLSFIVLFVPVFELHPLVGEISETSVIDIGKFVFVLAPIFLTIAAVASQLSASVADLGGSGGLVSELSQNKIKSKNAYLIIVSLGILLVIFFDIFKIISFASKAFAFYYFFECLSAMLFNFKQNQYKFIISLIFAMICLSIFIFGSSFE